jgi:DNA-binding transcriptional LysR family regulator
MLDLQALHAFVAVARWESFSTAAEHLFLTQPAVSKRVAGLEQTLGQRLFDRIGRRVTLTDAGRALLPRARTLLEDADALLQVVAASGDQVSGPLVMGTSHHVGLRRLPGALRAFNQHYPQVQLDIRFMSSEAACRAVEQGELELAVVTLPTGRQPRLRTQLVWDDPLEVLVSNDHPLASRGPLDLDELVAYPAVLPGPDTYTRSILAEALRPQGLAPRVVISTDYLETLRMLVATGLGWSLLPAAMAAPELVKLATPLRLSRRLGIVEHRNRSRSGAARARIQLLLDLRC